MQEFLDAVATGRWAAVVGFSLMLAVFFARRLLLKAIPKRDLDLATSGFAVVAVVASGLVASGGDWRSATQAVVSGLVVGATAIGFWQLLGKRVEAWAVKRAENSKSKDGEA